MSLASRVRHSGGRGAGLGGLPQGRGEVPPRAPSISPPLGRLGCSCCLGFPILRDMGNACWERMRTHLVLLEQKGNVLEGQSLGQKGCLGLCLSRLPPLPPTLSAPLQDEAVTLSGPLSFFCHIFLCLHLPPSLPPPLFFSPSLRAVPLVWSFHGHVGPVPSAGSPCPSDLRCHIHGEENMTVVCLSISMSIKIATLIVPIS